MNFKNFKLVAKYGEKEGKNAVEVMQMILDGRPVLDLNSFNELFLKGSLNDVLRSGPFWLSSFYVTPKVGLALPKTVEYGDDKLKIYVPVDGAFREKKNHGLTVILTPDNFNLNVSANGQEAEVVLNEKALAQAVKFKVPSEDGWFLFDENGVPITHSNSNDKNAFYWYGNQKAHFAGLGIKGSEYFLDHDRYIYIDSRPTHYFGLGVLEEQLIDGNNFDNLAEAKNTLEANLLQLKAKQDELQTHISNLQELRDVFEANAQKITDIELELQNCDALEAQQSQINGKIEELLKQFTLNYQDQ